MSDNVLKIVPVDCTFVPKHESHKSAIELLEKIADGEMCKVYIYDDIEFIDQGENLSIVICPQCKKRNELDFYDNANYASVIMENISTVLTHEKVKHAIIEMPCCEQSVYLTEIQFEWPAAFAKFELSIWNPIINGSLSDKQLQLFEDIFECKLKQIWAHY